MSQKLLLAAFVAFSAPSVRAEETVNDLLAKADAAKRRKDYDTAIACYDAAMKRDRDNMSAIRGMAWIRNDQGKHDLALFWVKEGFAIAVDDAALLAESGFANWKLGHTALAKQHLAKAIEINPKLTGAYNYLAAMLREEGNEDDAEAVESLKLQQAKK